MDGINLPLLEGGIGQAAVISTRAGARFGKGQGGQGQREQRDDRDGADKGLTPISWASRLSAVMR